MIQDLASTGWRLCCYTNRDGVKQGCESVEREAVGEAVVDRCFVYTEKLHSNERVSTLSGKGSSCY